MTLNCWKKSWLKARAEMKEVLMELRQHDQTSNRSEKVLAQNNDNEKIISDALQKHGLRNCGAMEVRSNDEDCRLWTNSLIQSVSNSKGVTAIILPKAERPLMSVYANNLQDGKAIYYDINGFEKQTALILELIKSRACNLLILSPSIIEDRLLTQCVTSERLNKTFSGNNRFFHAIMSISQATEDYGVPVVFIRRSYRRFENTGLSPIGFRMRIERKKLNTFRFIVERDTSEEKNRFAKTEMLIPDEAFDMGCNVW